MAHFDLGAYFDERRALIERALDAHLPAGDSEPKAVHEAMRYATLGGGKRLRPILALAVAELAGGPAERFIEAACAIELVHTASLVVDDLPAMDDAATRRGKPCAHKVYGEATTILAAVGLLSLAFSLVIRNAQACGVCNQADCVANRLADAIGTRGIIHGQHDDLSFVGRDASIEQLEAAYMQKASCLFQLA
ncbi:MAG: polyprenyl synthetase family protein, partial [Candidatus Hydrogenedentes bacterium]|nr:polyprenyl synthetase family protein [Candidatus Hydrogenedentota bacterium]